MIDRVFVRHHDVQPGTGRVVSTVRSGQWARGILLRAPTPAFLPPPQQLMPDPSQPHTWSRR